jgi:hypothetical protein
MATGLKFLFLQQMRRTFKLRTGTHTWIGGKLFIDFACLPGKVNAVRRNIGLANSGLDDAYTDSAEDCSRADRVE